MNHTKQLKDLYNDLLNAYGYRKWWHATSRFEIIVGAILVQNTNWNNARIALSSLKKHALLRPAAIKSLPIKDLKSHIKPAGLYNQKANYLKAISKFLLDNGYNTLNKLDTLTLRNQLLAVRGIGNETADVILLYVFKRPVFIADNYSQRLLLEKGLIKNKLNYKSLQQIFHDALEKDVEFFGEYHALIVHHHQVNRLS